MWKTKQMISDIMEDFDFELVHKAMEIKWWQWAFGDSMRTPTLEEVKTVVKQMLKESCEIAKNTLRKAVVSTGWFVYEVELDDNWKIDNILLNFVLTQSASFREYFI